MRTLENIDIKRVMEHWECYINDRFFCSGDTLDEIMKEVQKVYG